MRMSYRVKEMIYTLQGEGANTGAAVVLCRFEGCNLDCSFCDTDHKEGEYLTVDQIVGYGDGDAQRIDDFQNLVAMCTK